jgi:hypothetical protein
LLSRIDVTGRLDKSCGLVNSGLITTEVAPFGGVKEKQAWAAKARITAWKNMSRSNM